MYSKSLTKPLVADAMKQGARYFLLIALCFLLRPSVAEAVKVELDQGSSWSIASMSVISYSNAEGPFSPASDSWSGSGIQYDDDILVEAYQATSNGMCGSSAASSISISGHALNAYPEPGEQKIEGKEIYDIRFYVDCLAEPCPTPYPFTPILAWFDCELSAVGEIVWELLPSTEDEEIGTPVTVSFGPVGYSLGGLSGGTVYEFRILDWVYGVTGREMEGPYEVANYADPPDYGSTPEPVWQHLDINAYIGDKIRLGYKMEGFAYTQNDESVPSNLTPDGEYPTMGLSVALWVVPSGPMVEISEEPEFVVQYQPIHKSPVETLTAQANQPGGAYQWEIIQGQDKARLFPEYGQETKIQVLAPSKERNDVIVKVTYHSPDGKTAEAFKTLTVKRPFGVSIVDWKLIGKNYLGEIIGTNNKITPYWYYYRYEYTMQVCDQFGDPIEKRGIPWNEERTYACREHPEKLTGRPEPRDKAETDDLGQFPDNLTFGYEITGKKEPKNPEDFLKKVQQVFKVGGHMLLDEGKFCQTYEKESAWSTPGECPCP